MKSVYPPANVPIRWVALMLAVPLFFTAKAARAEDYNGWSLNFTPVLIAPKDGDDLGGGVDPEVKYTVDRGAARLSAGFRVGGYYVKNLYALMMMPTLRITVPVGPVEPYAAFGMGYGWILKKGHDDIASMSRLGVVFRLSERFALGVEGTLQKIDNGVVRFVSLGSMVSIDF
jgi:hypothetical protein